MNTREHRIRLLAPFLMRGSGATREQAILTLCHLSAAERDVLWKVSRSVMLKKNRTDNRRPV